MIKAYTELIRDISGEDRQKREANLDVITREADRLMSLVNDILDISVLQSGSEQMRRESFNLSETVSGVMSRFSPITSAAFAAAIEPDQYVYADERRITQVLYNFLANAAAHNDGHDISVSLSDEGGFVRFVINDCGGGIAEDELPLIWERYYKSKSASGGTGLGLAIAKEILQAHGARFGVASKLDVGTTFWFELKK
jgi:signal transduction histidine kinase